MVGRISTTARAAESGMALLQRSELAMRATHFEHAQGQITSTYRGRHAILRITGDCDTVAAPHDPRIRAAESMKARTWVRGTEVGIDRRIHRVDAHFVEFGYADAAKLWVRSSATHNLWKREHWTDATDFRSFIPDACVIGFVAAPRTPPPGTPPPGKSFPVYQNLGKETLGGRRVWHLRAQMTRTNIVNADDLYIDDVSHLWLRRRLTYHGNVVDTFDFSRFGQR
jgi:hypothetical protein